VAVIVAPCWTSVASSSATGERSSSIRTRSQKKGSIRTAPLPRRLTAPQLAAAASIVI
jgi:hypothetical protein